jgi:hypothetical protein
MTSTPSGGPIFITGLDRSGKTPLRRMLSVSPALSLTRRSRLWTLHYGRYGDLATAGTLDRCLSALEATPGSAELLGDVAALRAEFAAGPAAYSRLFALIHDQHAHAHGRRRWGDQDAEIERHADRLLAELPDARIIHLVRDPLSRYTSLALERRCTLGGVGDATAAWLISARRALRNRHRHRGRYLIVRAEDLATNTTAELSRVCRFIGEAYLPEMESVVMPDFAPPRGSRPTALDALFVRELAGAPLLALGYAPPGTGPSLPGHFAYCVWHRPVALARAGWRAARELTGNAS